MLQQSFFIKPAVLVLLTGLFTAGCTSSDYNREESTTTSTDTGSVMQLDTAMHADTTRMNVPVNTSVDTTAVSTGQPMGTAKPNPAKKGMKGKVTISPAPKSTAKMEADKAGVYENVEYIPSFPGGNAGLQKYFNDNLQYPPDASSEGVEGTVNVSFVVDENGQLSAAQVIGEKLGYGLEEEALRVINRMPAWTPGKLKGQNVKTRYTMPVKFVLY